MTGKFSPREHPLLYEINTVAWLFEQSQKLGKPVHLRDVPSEEWDRLKHLGMDYVWLMGVWSRSQEGRKVSLNEPEFHQLFTRILPNWQPEDIVGSCYSISSYEVDPLVGTIEDIDHIHDELHRRNMGLILDFVPNHTGIDHRWLREHPEYYIRVEKTDYEKDLSAYFPIDYRERTLYFAHGRDPNFPSWTDTAQLNYFNPDTRQALLELLGNLSSHCDGFRCDMAMLVLNDIFRKSWGWANKNPGYTMPKEEFWSQVTKRFPGLIWIAEAYWDTEWNLQQLGFDFVYDKRLYDRLRHNNPNEVYLHLTADLDYQRKLLRFIENHDEERSVFAFGAEMAKAVAVLYSGLPGMKLYFHGQLEGKKIRLPLQIRRSETEAVDNNLSEFYSSLLAIVNDESFHNGLWKIKKALPGADNSYQNIIAYTWKTKSRIMLVIVNLSAGKAEGRIVFQDEISEQMNYSFTGCLEGQSFITSGKLMAHPGMWFQLAGYQAQILEIKSVSMQ